MALQTECIAESTLRSYWNGYLEPSEATEIEEHMSQCAECNSRLKRIEELPESDSLIDPLRDIGASLLDRNGANHDQLAAEKLQQVYPPQMPGEWIGAYKLLGRLGRGGMGSVYLAEHSKLRKKVALKVLHMPWYSPEVQSRFEREIEAVGRLQFPSIVAATDAGQVGDLHYLVMEFVDGADLSKLVRAIPHPPIPEVCEIGRQVALALDHAHRLGFVHRDIKPSNIMLDQTGQVKLLDFGLVMIQPWEQAISELTTVGQFLGTLDYMAPEQAERSGHVDYRADLYGLGATLFRLLCGFAPLALTPHLSPLEKLRLLANHNPPRLKTVRPDANEELCQLIDELLSTSPAQRPMSAAHVAELLAPHAIGSQLSRLMATVDLDELSRQSQHKERDASLPIARFLEKPDQNAEPGHQQPAEILSTSSQSDKRIPVLGWFAMACVPIAFLAGVLLRLDTKEGQLVVESDVPNVSLSLKRDDEAVEQTLRIETGNTVTKLKGGKYKLELNSPSDGVTIENGTFSITNNQTVIARVRLESSSQQTTMSPLEKPRMQLPRYKGMAFDDCLDTLRSEQDHVAWTVGAEGVIALIGLDAEQSLFDEVYDILRKRESFQLLSRWTDPRIETQFLAEIDKGSHDEQVELLRHIGKHFDLSRMRKVLDWVESQHAKDLSKAKWLYFAIANWSETIYSNRSKTPYLTGNLEKLEAVSKSHPQLFDRYEEAIPFLILSENKKSDLQTQVAKRILSRGTSPFPVQVMALRVLVPQKNTGWESVDTQEFVISAWNRLTSDIPKNTMSQFPYQVNNSIQSPLTSSVSSFYEYPSIQLIEMMSGRSDFFTRGREHSLKIVGELLSFTNQDAISAYNRYESIKTADPFGSISLVWKDLYGRLPIVTPSAGTTLPVDTDVEELKRQTVHLLMHKELVYTLTRRIEYTKLNPNMIKEWLDLQKASSSRSTLPDDNKISPSEESNRNAEPVGPIGISLFNYLELNVLSPHEEKMQAWIRAKIKVHDKNQDDKLDRDEFQSYSPKGNFELSDLDRDGLLSIKELVLLFMRK